MADEITQIEALYVEANKLRLAGSYGEAAEVCRRVLEIEAKEPAALQFLAGWSFSEGEFESAADYMQRYTEIDPNSVESYHALGVSLEALERHGEAIAAFRRAIGLKPQNPASLLYLGGAFEAAGEKDKATEAFSLAVDVQPNVKHWYAPAVNVPELLKDRARRSDTLLGELGQSLSQEALARTREQFADADLSRIEDGFWRKLYMGEVQFADFDQQPMTYYVPGLAPRPWFEREEFDWIEGFEAECAAIRDEVLASLSVDDDTVPYIGAGSNEKTWGGLVDSLDWGSLHFYNDSKRNDAAFAKLPHTGSVIDALPLFGIGEKPIEALISVLKPQTQIPPHFGLSNVRLTVHLPLIVPDDCSVKAGSESRPTEEGKCLIFDDSYRHEAWNNSGEVRIVLIVEAWHPDLSEAERAAVRETFRGYDEWMSCRDVKALLAQ